MAATASYGSLAVPQPEDTMDMSSPSHHGHEDIDIDFDDFSGTAGLVDDAMQDDVDPTNVIVGGADADMEDGLPRPLETVLEAEMSDHMPGSNYNDDGNDEMADEDELIDYDDEEWTLHEQHSNAANPSEPELTEPLFAGAVSAAVEDATASTVDLKKDADKAEIAPSLANAEENTEPDVQSDTRHELPGDEDLAAQHTTDGPSHVSKTIEGHPPLKPSIHPQNVPEEHLENQSKTRDFSAHDEPEDSKAADPEVADVTAAGDVESDAIPVRVPDSPTDTGLHPVILRYGSEEFYLFKSKHQPDGLLEDDNLCNVSFSELIGHCKSCLAELKDMTISSSDKEAILSFESLPLVMLTETSRAAFEQSLNDVIDVFLQLHHNDGAVDIPPLVLTLSLQYKFTSSLDLFKHMADAGQGYNEIPGIPLFDESQEEEDDTWFENDQGAENDENDAEEDTHEDYGHGYENAQDLETASQEVAASKSVVIPDPGSDVIAPEAVLEEDPSTIGAQKDEHEIDSALNRARDHEALDEQNPEGERFEEEIRHDAEDEDAVQNDHVSLKLENEDDINRRDAANATVSPPSDQLTEQVEVGDLTQPTGSSKTPDVDEHPTQTEQPLVDNSAEITPTSLQTKPTIEDPNVSSATADSLTNDHNLTQESTQAISGKEHATDTLDEDHGLDKTAEISDLDEQHDDIPFDIDVHTNLHTSEIFDEDDSPKASYADLENKVETVSNAANGIDEFDEDTIDFDDDTTEQHEARVQARSTITEHESPPTKRTFSDQAEDDLLDFEDEPETKKARAS